jgi:hypothetical protein
MAELARTVMIDVDTKEFIVDGKQFPWAYSGVTPTVVEDPDTGTLYPGVTVTIVCTDVQTYKPSEVLSDELPSGD